MTIYFIQVDWRGYICYMYIETLSAQVSYTYIQNIAIISI